MKIADINEPQSLWYFAQRRIILAGKTRELAYLKRVMGELGVEPDGTTSRGQPAFLQATVEAAVAEYLSQGRHGGGAITDEDLIEIRKETAKQNLIKLRKQNEIATRELEKRDLEIESLKARLVDYDECYKYLLARKAIHTALLRRILITDIPMTLAGMEATKAREICERYYNEVMNSLVETTNLWRKKYASGADKDLEKQIDEDIRRIINGK